jgi:diguanylate cyclase (GGDEF)-like protein/PAS domain S-box-containing protein
MQNINLLIVDDSKTFNNMVSMLFAEYGYNIVQAYDLKTTLEILKTQKIDYVILDMNLPDGSGAYLVDEIQKIASPRIIVMTGSEEAKDRDALFVKGIVDYFIKTTPTPIIVNCANKLIETIESHQNTNILTIDDSEFMRVVLKSILHSKGYNLFEASCAKEGKKVLQNEDIHLILLDLIMPEVDGMSFLEDIKEDKNLRDIPVIVISADTSRSNYARVLKQGANDFIQKPFIVEEVLLKCDIQIKSHLLYKQIQEQKKDIEKQNRYHRNLMEINLDPLVTISKTGRILDANQATVTITGVSKDTLIGSDFSQYFSDPNKAKEGYIKVIKDGKLLDYLLQFKNIDGKNIDVLYNASTYSDENGVLEGVFASARDISQIVKLQEDLKYMAMYDHLTQIPNRYLLMEKGNLLVEEAKRYNTQLVVAFLDLNNLKVVNDNYGHKVGDELLIWFAKNLQNSLRGSDIVSRLGGDEFVIIFNKTDKDMIEYKNVIKGCLSKEKFTFSSDENILEMDITSSIGLAHFPDDADNLESLINIADKNMYKEKHKKYNIK